MEPTSQLSLPRLAVGAFFALAALGGISTISAAPASAVSCPVVHASVLDGAGTLSTAPIPGIDWSGCNLTGADLSNATAGQTRPAVFRAKGL